MVKQQSIILLLFLLVGLLGAAPDLGADNLSCLICHNSLEGNYTTRDGDQTSLFVDAEKYAASVHGILECTSCHVRYQDNPHQSLDEDVDEAILAVARAIEKKSPIDPVAQAACDQCHPEIFAEVKASVHGANIFEKKETDGALCIDCHGSPHEIVSASAATPEETGMYSPVAYEHVVETCGRCHEKKSVSLKYGFSTAIVDRYFESFHGKKYHLGGKNLPVCTNCHGSHNVRSQTDPESLVYGDNKIALCGECHKGANSKFVAAITHKPIGKDNPIPFYAEKILILLTMGVIGGCALHIAFQVYASIRDALRNRRRI